MKRLLCAVFLLLTATTGFGQRHRHHARSGTTGQFDYYLFALSWSPEYCHSHATSAQCTAAKPFSFVVHGLWPEYNSGSGPENCGSAPGPTNPSQYLDIMPDLGLIQHEWTTHGTCTGLPADEYFGLIRRAYNSVRIPARFATLATAQTESPQQVKKEFEAVNGNLSDSSLQINCASNYLQAVEVCLDKSLSPIACSAPRDCRAQTIHIPPVR